MRKVSGKVIPLRGLGDGTASTAPPTPQASSTPPPPAPPSLTVTDVLTHLERGIVYSQQAASRLVKLIPPGVASADVQKLLSTFPDLQKQLAAARDKLKAAPPDSNEQTLALEDAGAALQALANYIDQVESLVEKNAPAQSTAVIAKTRARGKLILFGSIGAAIVVGVGVWLLARKRRRRYSSTRLKLKAVPE